MHTMRSREVSLRKMQARKSKMVMLGLAGWSMWNVYVGLFNDGIAGVLQNSGVDAYYWRTRGDDFAGFCGIG